MSEKHLNMKSIEAELEQLLKEDENFGGPELEQLVGKLSRYTAEQPMTSTSSLAEKLSATWGAMQTEGDAEAVGEAANFADSGAVDPMASIVDDFSLPYPLLILRHVRRQVHLFRFSFWAVSALILIVGGLLGMAFEGRSIHPFAFTTPILAALSICIAFRSIGKPMFELEMSFPITPTQLVFTRLALIIAYDIAIALVVTLAVNGASAVTLAYIANWLVPLGLSCVVALVAMLYYGFYAGMISSLALWVIQLVVSDNLGVLYFFGSDVSSGVWLTSKLLGLAVTGVLLIAVWARTRTIAAPGGRIS